MKKSLKTLKLDKEVISTLDLSKVEGGWHGGGNPPATGGALLSCPPPGVFCF